jgi:hypothetical protein
MGCNDDYGSSLQSRITLSGLVKGVKLLIIIKGYAGEYGNYARLNIIKNQASGSKSVQGWPEASASRDAFCSAAAGGGWYQISSQQ